LAEVSGLTEHRGRFKTTTLRNIAVTAPYMHDGRFATLEEVVDFYADDVVLTTSNLDEHMLPWVNDEIHLNAQDRADLVAFMHALTDEQFLSDPRFSDPH
jgi:cytochrome c peroxidase